MLAKKISLLVFVSIISSKTMAASVCQNFAKEREVLTPTAVVDPQKDEISKIELKMIQLAVMINSVTVTNAALTPKEALDIFTDREDGRDGSLGGQISYFKTLSNGKNKIVALVTFFPGDNEYGALFEMPSNGRGNGYLIGTVGDSDIACLVAAN